MAHLSSTYSTFNSPLSLIVLWKFKNRSVERYCVCSASVFTRGTVAVCTMWAWPVFSRDTSALFASSSSHVKLQVEVSWPSSASQLLFLGKYLDVCVRTPFPSASLSQLWKGIHPLQRADGVTPVWIWVSPFHYSLHRDQGKTFHVHRWGTRLVWVAFTTLPGARDFLPVSITTKFFRAGYFSWELYAAPIAQKAWRA